MEIAGLSPRRSLGAAKAKGRDWKQLLVLGSRLCNRHILCRHPFQFHPIGSHGRGVQYFATDYFSLKDQEKAKQIFMLFFLAIKLSHLVNQERYELQCIFQ